MGKKTTVVPDCCEQSRTTGAVQVLDSERDGRDQVMTGHAEGPGCVRYSVLGRDRPVTVRSNRCPFCHAYLPGRGAVASSERS